MMAPSTIPTLAGVRTGLHELLEARKTATVPATFDEEGNLDYLKEGAEQIPLKPLLTLSDTSSSFSEARFPGADETPRVPLRADTPLDEATTLTRVRHQMQGILDIAVAKRREGLRIPERFLTEAPMPPPSIMRDILLRQTFDAFIMDVGDTVLHDIRNPTERALHGARHLLSAAENLAALGWFSGSAMFAEFAASHGGAIALMQGGTEALQAFSAKCAKLAAEGWHAALQQSRESEAQSFCLDRGIFHAWAVRKDSPLATRLYREAIKREPGGVARAAADSLRLVSLFLEKESPTIEEWSYVAVVLMNMSSMARKLAWDEQTTKRLHKLAAAARAMALPHSSPISRA